MFTTRKKFAVALIVFFIICLGGNCIKVSAMEKYKKVYELKEGGYVITSLVKDSVYSGISKANSTRGSVTASKYARYYSAEGKLQFTAIIRATFNYNGSSATVTSANYGYSISNGAWSFVSGQSSYSGNSATARCTFSSSTYGNKNLAVTICCSPNGEVS